MINCKLTLPGPILWALFSNSLTHFSRFTNVFFAYTELSMRYDVKLHTIQQIYAPSVNRLTGSRFCSVTGYDMAASFIGIASIVAPIIAEVFKLP